MNGSVQQTIEAKLATVDPLHLEIVNESNRHNVPAGSETHFKVVVISDRFRGSTLIQRHRLVNELLREEMAGPIHALSLHLFTSEEWQKRFGSVPTSPPCHGGEPKT